MVIAFIIWSVISITFLVIGIIARLSKKPVEFWANVKAPEVNDVKRYNKDVSVLWFVFAVLFEIVGIPLLFCEQSSLIAFISIFGTVVLAIGIMIAYTLLEAKYRK
ncbi:MAG: hypothetical protein GX995_10945 [Clostridiales bacterium]|nr:hypothetical protein [Clostridiales bacterium]